MHGRGKGGDTSAMIISEFRYKGRWTTIRVPNAGAPISVTIDSVPMDGCFDSLREARAAAIKLIDAEAEGVCLIRQPQAPAGNGKYYGIPI